MGFGLFRVSGLGLRVQGRGFEVKGFGPTRCLEPLGAAAVIAGGAVLKNYEVAVKELKLSYY